MAKFKKKAPEPKADAPADNAESSNDAMPLTLGGNKPSSGAGYGTSSKAHQSRAAGNDASFVFGAEPESTAGESADSVYELPGAQGAGMPGRSMEAPTRVHELKPEGSS